ncbi:hypothetical protein RJ639_001960 [Escallonia herrerae]|uniref:non-specific serine/threonine protein kinase n=1 Tax=Escallonia herrerae TaxID=1293975 RepID=A0AA88XCB6_9ASTE|nr:hypothetical protein RJ639_001960 [Escallonia herrerae]
MASVLIHLSYIHVFLSSFLVFTFCNLPFSTLASTVLGNETDHLALLSFRAELTSQEANQVMASWNESTHFCNWVGVTCGKKHRRVIAIHLQSMELSGSLSPAIGNLSFLREVSLFNNDFTGKIPSEIGRLSRLRSLVLANNSFSGEIPANISGSLNLVKLDLAGNHLVGNIPMQFQSLSKLQLLFLYSNNLTGEVPRFLGNLSDLRRISALENKFYGNLPDTLGRLTNLTFIGFSANKLSGTLPLSIFNMSALTNIDLADNMIEGELPSDMGLNIPRLKVLNIAGNKLTGVIPVSITNASNLVRLAGNGNGFTGRVPNFDGLQTLEWLALNKNQLGSGEAGDLSFLSSLVNCTELYLVSLVENNFGGTLPKSIGNFSNLVTFALGVNQISGNIPPEIGKLAKLESLFLGPNQLAGSIPSSIGNLGKIRRLSLSGNQLTGTIPSSLGNLSQLINLDLGYNRLQGQIPSTVAKCETLQLIDLSYNNLSDTIPRDVFGLPSLSIFLDLSNNHLTGPLLLEKGDFENLGYFDVSNNLLSDEIPGSLGSCTSLTFLAVAGNLFRGGIPQSLSSLRAIEVLDLSRNKLTGQIPDYLGKFMFLTNLNLSFNDFEGKVPEGRVFKNASEVTLDGNSKLCGGVRDLQLPRCGTKHAVSRVLKVAIPLSCGILLLILAFFYVFVNKRRLAKKVSLSNSSMGDILLKLSYGSLYKATEGFSSTNLLGSGQFSSVYKGILEENETVVAVKVLNLQVRGASKSFMAECEALRSIRHRNLVKILTSCSTIDFQGNDFKALVYAYMANGSLDGIHQASTHKKYEKINECLTSILRIGIACSMELPRERMNISDVTIELHSIRDTFLARRTPREENRQINDEMI